MNLTIVCLEQFHFISHIPSTAVVMTTTSQSVHRLIVWHLIHPQKAHQRYAGKGNLPEYTFTSSPVLPIEAQLLLFGRPIPSTPFVT